MFLDWICTHISWFRFHIPPLAYCPIQWDNNQVVKMQICESFKFLMNNFLIQIWIVCILFTIAIVGFFGDDWFYSLFPEQSKVTEPHCRLRIFFVFLRIFFVHVRGFPPPFPKVGEFRSPITPGSLRLNLDCVRPLLPLRYCGFRCWMSYSMICTSIALSILLLFLNYVSLSEYWYLLLWLHQ